MKRLCKNFEQGLEDHHNDDQESAKKSFDLCLVIKADDAPSRYYQDKILHGEKL